MARRSPAAAQARAIMQAALAAPKQTPQQAMSPLVQSYGATAGQGFIDANVLPRPASVFSEASFGPAVPLYPSAVDQPDDETGVVLPRRTQYPVSWNLPIGIPGSEGLGKLAPFSTLREMGDNYSVVRTCIDTRVREFLGLEWDVQPTRKAQRAMEGSTTARTDFERRRSEVMSFWERPDRAPDSPYRTWEDWMTVLLEDMLVCDASALYLHPSVGGRGGGWLGSNLGSLTYIDGSCYSADTEVLTRRGWLTFDKVDITTDEFATRNQKSKAFEWQEATYFHEADHDGDMYAFESRTLDLLVTPNHRMLVRPFRGAEEVILPAKELAERLNGNQAIPAYSGWDAPDIGSFDFEVPTKAAACAIAGCARDVYARGLCDSHGRSRRDAALPRRRPGKAPSFVSITGDDFAAFMGMWLSEGCVCRHGGVRKRPTVYVTQQRESKGFEQFHDLLCRLLGREPAYNGSSFYFRHAPLAEYLAQFGHAREKYLPSVIKEMSRRQLAIFWHFYMLGDGHTEQSGRQSIVTSSRQMADDLQEVAQKLGFSASVGVSEPDRDSRINGRQIIARGPRFTVRLRTSAAQIPKARLTHYEGKVYCVSVPNEVLYVRRHGQPAWCGNTIRPLYGNLGGAPPPSAVAYQQFIWGIPRVDFAAMAEGRDVAELPDYDTEYKYHELMYLVSNPRSWAPYGLSSLESVLLPASIGMARQRGQLDFYTEGSVPFCFVVPGQELVSSPTQVSQLQVGLNALAGDTGWKQKIVVLPPGSKPVDMKPHQMSDDFDNLIVALNTMGFGLTPLDVGLTPKMAALQGNFGARQLASSADSSSRDRWLRPRAQWLKASIFDWVIQRVLGQKDMQWVWKGLESNEDFNMLVEQAVQIVHNSLGSVDEGRALFGWDPLGLPETSVPGVFGPGTFVPLTQAPTTHSGQQPGPAALPRASDSLTGRTDARGEPTTPASEAAERAARTPRVGPAAAKAQLAELDVLNRKLQKGHALEDFEVRTLSPSVMAAVRTGGIEEGRAEVLSVWERHLAEMTLKYQSGEVTAEQWAFEVGQAHADGVIAKGPAASAPAATPGPQVNDPGIFGPGGKGDPNPLRRWYSSKDSGINWDHAGDFYACVKIASKYIDDPEGFCALRHKQATGAWPGHAPGETGKSESAEITKSTAGIDRRHDEIVDHYAPRLSREIAAEYAGKLRAIIEECAEGVANVPEVGKAKSAIWRFVRGVVGEVLSRLEVDFRKIVALLRSLIADGYVTGTKEATDLIGTDEGVEEAIKAEINRISWPAWRPGNPSAALMAAEGGLRDMLAQADIAIKAMDATLVDRLGDEIAGGLIEGEAVTSIAKRLDTLIHDAARATLIARTETARAMDKAILDNMANMGIAEWNWLTAGTARKPPCPRCVYFSEHGPYPVGGGPVMPAHPNCRCVPVPLLPSLQGAGGR